MTKRRIEPCDSKRRIEPCDFKVKSSVGLLSKEIFTNEEGVLVIDDGVVQVFLCAEQVQAFLERVRVREPSE